MRKRLIELGRLDLPLPLAVVEEVPALFFSQLFLVVVVDAVDGGEPPGVQFNRHFGDVPKPVPDQAWSFETYLKFWCPSTR